MEKDVHKKILVTGATGKQGGAVIEALLSRTFSLRALVRDLNKKESRALSRQGVELALGDLNDSDSLRHVLEGVDGVYSVQALVPRAMETEVRQGVLLAELAKQSGVSHFVYSSVWGANRNSGVPHFETKWRIEQRIRELALPCTILRPVFFMENWLAQSDLLEREGVLKLPLTSDRKLPEIATRDIGIFAAKAFENPSEWIGREIDLASEELTLPEVAAIAEELLGRPVRYEPITWDSFRWERGEELTRMFQWFQDARIEVDIAAVRQLHPEMLTLREFLIRHGWEKAAQRKAG